MTKPSLPQGTRDFNAETVRKRTHILQTIREVFELFGFEPLETPAMENLDTLMGKYGDEGDQLIFKILNNGLHHPAKQQQAAEDFAMVVSGRSHTGITERALRYDLTIPFARYVAMNHGQLALPFRRYQVQPVWRADRPQRGRYREFYQCDADVVGSYSLLNEVELMRMYQLVFKRLNIPVEIRINSRKMLAALAETCGAPERLTDITVAIDKLDKAGSEKVKDELSQKGFSASQVALIDRYFQATGDNATRLSHIRSLLQKNDAAEKGAAEIEYLLSYAGDQPSAPVLFDPTLARGLNYYTGIIFEVKATGIQMGSIGGGGRYDDLTGSFGVKGIPGVGISFGVDRIYDVMEELNVFPAGVQAGTQLIFFNMGEEESRLAVSLAGILREKGVRAEIYPDKAKLDKQFKYADRKGIGYALIIGDQELANGTCTVKNLRTGSQETVPLENLTTMNFAL